jgi:hypothetical protein
MKIEFKLRVGSYLGAALALAAIGLIGLLRDSSYGAIVPAEYPPADRLIEVLGDRNGDRRSSSEIGFNELFIVGYGRSQGYQCPLWNDQSQGKITQCDNTVGLPLILIEKYLDILADRGIRVHRDVVPIKYFSDPSNLNNIIAVMLEYQKRQMKLIFVPGFPMTGPTSHNGLMCVPTDDQRFSDVAYTIANYSANFFKSLRASGRLDSAWLTNNVMIESWNEFDGAADLKTNADGTEFCKLDEFLNGSPVKAAKLQAIMAYVFWKNDFKNEITAPSIVNVYKGPMSEQVRPGPKNKFENMRIYMKDYYAAGGKGRPALHIYYGGQPPAPSTTATDLVIDLEQGLRTVLPSIPTQYRRHVEIGETGFPEASSHCTFGLNKTMRIEYYKDVFKSTYLKQNAEMLLFWRLAQIDPVPADGKPLGDCEATFGVLPLTRISGDNL